MTADIPTIDGPHHPGSARFAELIAAAARRYEASFGRDFTKPGRAVVCYSAYIRRDSRPVWSDRGEFFPSLHDAMTALGRGDSGSNIRMVLNCTKRSAYGRKWFSSLHSRDRYLKRSKAC